MNGAFLNLFQRYLSLHAGRSVFLWAALAILPAVAWGQTPSSDALPDAPSVWMAQSTPPPAQAPASSGSSSSAAPQTTPPAAPSAQQPSSEDELKQEEKQRILGFVPNFNTVYGKDAPPLTAKQKFQLDMKSALDPFTFGAAAVDAGLNEAQDQYTEYGWGALGYGKRFAASYADTFDGGLWGNAILPIWWHEDPRYFRMGTGSFTRRALYSAATTVWCRRDNGTWGPSYANVAGNFVALDRNLWSSGRMFRSGCSARKRSRRWRDRGGR